MVRGFGALARRDLLALLAAAWIAGLGIASAEAAPANNLRELGGQFFGCLNATGYRRDPKFEATFTISFRRDGTVVDKPYFTYRKFIGDDNEKAAAAADLVKAIDQCAPFGITDALGSAIAGRVFMIVIGPDPGFYIRGQMAGGRRY